MTHPQSRGLREGHALLSFWRRRQPCACRTGYSILLDAPALAGLPSEIHKSFHVIQHHPGSVNLKQALLHPFGECTQIISVSHSGTTSTSHLATRTMTGIIPSGLPGV